jgi:hypothetical protein
MNREMVVCRLECIRVSGGCTNLVRFLTAIRHGQPNSIVYEQAQPLIEGYPLVSTLEEGFAMSIRYIVLGSLICNWSN